MQDDFCAIVRALIHHFMNSKVDDLDHFATQTPQQNIVKAPKKKKNAKYMRKCQFT